MSQASAQAMLTPGLGHWGLGIQLDGAGRDFHFTHGGDDWGFKANMMAWPDGGRAVVAMANGDDGMIVVVELMQAVARAYGWKGLEPLEIEPVTLSEAQRKAVVGSYGHGVAVVSQIGAGLAVTYGGSTVELLPRGTDRFVADPAGANVDVQLGRAPDGGVRTLSALGLTLPRDP
jgi:hypothetical protein